MAISFVDSASNWNSNGNNVTVTLPSLLQDDLVIFAAGIGDNDNVDFNMAMSTAGYTEVADLFADDASDTNLAVYWKVMGSTPDTTAVFTGQGGQDAAVAGVAMCFRGVDTATPMDVTPTTATGIDTMHPNPPSIDHNNPSGVWTVIAGASGNNVPATQTATNPTNYTTNPKAQQGQDTTQIMVAMGYRTDPADPEDPGAFVFSGTDSTSYSWAAVTLALRPFSTLTTKSASESAAVVGSEVSTVVPVFSVTDTATVALTDLATFLAPVSSADSAVIGATEAALILSAVATSESVGVGSSELIGILATSTLVDSLSVQIGEGLILATQMLPGESCAVQVTELSGSPAAVFSTVETCAVVCADVGGISLMGSFCTDTIAIQWYTDNAALGDRTFFQQDSLAAGLADQWRTVIGTDTLGITDQFTHWEVAEVFACAITEYGQGLHNIVVLGLQDATPAVVVVVSVADTCTVQASDASPILAAVISLADSAAVRAIDSYVPFPITSVLDTFNRANEGPPPSASWSNAFQASLQVVGNELVGGDIGREGAAGWNTAFSGSDLEVFTTIGSVALTDGGGPFALLFRMQQPNDYLSDSYRMKVQNSGGLGFVEIVRFQGGGTQVGYSYLSGPIAVGDQIGVSIIGSIFRVYWKGALVLTFTDSGVTTGNYVGLWVITGLATTFDNFGGGPSAVGGASIFSTLSVPETCAVVAVEDQPLILVSKALADTCAVQISEAVTLVVTVSVADAAAVQVSDVATVIATLSVSDSCAIQADDSATPVVDKGSTLIPTTESCAIQASDATPAILVTLSVADSAAVQSTESMVILGTMAIADSAGIGATDVLVILATGTVTETLTLTLTELPSIVVTNTVADTCVLVASEGMANVIQNTLIGVTDSCAVLASEGSPLIGQVFIVADSLAVVAGEQTVGPHAAIAQEALTIQASEAVTNSLATLASETITLGLQDAQPLLPLAFSVSEALEVLISEVGTQSVFNASIPIAATDSVVLGLDDQITGARELLVSDSVPIVVDEMVAAPAIPAEQVALLLLEEVRLEITLLEHIWAGGMRKEEAHFLYAGSYRMGERNPDETKGGIW